MQSCFLHSVGVLAIISIDPPQKACEGPRVTLFQRDFLLAYEVIDPR